LGDGWWRGAGDGAGGEMVGDRRNWGGGGGEGLGARGWLFGMVVWDSCLIRVFYYSGSMYEVCGWCGKNCWRV
jgi:hypothetical protein